MAVSIGPLHWNNNDKLVPMEAHKLKYLEYFLGNPQANVDLLNSCLRIVKGMETQIRECYADPIYLSSNEFCKMVLTDSVFIIELFRRDYLKEGNDDYLYSSPFLIGIVWRDMRLEENQLPFFILDQLYRAAYITDARSSNNPVPSFTEIACEFLQVKLDGNTNIVDQPIYCHLLHLLACHSEPAGMPIRSNYVDVLFPAATSLHEAGVKFQVIEDSSSELDIEFDKDKGILKMPKIIIGDGTESRCRNLIAFEQCHYNKFQETRYFTDYYTFLNQLINTPEDVQLLADANIIKVCVGSAKEVSDLINTLDYNAYPTAGGGYYYGSIAWQLIRHSSKRWNRYRATLMHTYFNHPWAAISVVYAVVLLLLTIIQVVAGIMAIP